MTDLYPPGFAADGRFVLDRFAGPDDGRVCECQNAKYATRIARALSLMGQLEEAYTSDHDEMLYLALKALGKTKFSDS